MHKFFVPLDNIFENLVKITDDDVKHIYKVLRLNVGDEICINDCTGNEYLANIKSINKKEVNAEITKKLELNNESKINITLYQGLPKATKMDLIVQKNTELGVKAITPVITERVVAKGDLKEFKKLDRWNRIALEACKQCKRSSIPKINAPINFNYVLEELKEFDLIIIPYENKKNYGIKTMINEISKQEIENIAIMIGPEGGFAESEIEKFKEINAKIVTLGPRILRTETAGFVCVSLVMYELGDLGGI